MKTTKIELKNVVEVTYIPEKDYAGYGNNTVIPDKLKKIAQEIDVLLA
jgi:hypothetical protein